MKFRTIAIVFLVAVVLALAWQLNVQLHLKRLLDWMSGLGAAGALVFVLVYIISAVLFVPGSILTLGAGFLYGLVRGTILVSVASTLGATSAFLIGRYLARDWVAKKVSGSEKFAAIDQAIGREGWKVVGLLRLSPVVPFNLLNYALGLTKVSLKHYVLASWIGMLPATVLYVYIGSIAASLTTLGAGAGSRTAAQWVVYMVGLLATVAVTVYITNLARRALRKKVV